MSELDVEELRRKGVKELRSLAHEHWDSLHHLVTIRTEALRRHRKNPQQWSRTLADEVDERVGLLAPDTRPKVRTRKWVLAGGLGLIGAVLYGVAHGAGQDIWLFIRTLGQS